MASDWIKMRTDLYRDPKVCAIADLLMDEDGELAAYVNQNMQRDMTVTRNVMRNVTVGALVSVWGVMRHRGKRVNNDLRVSAATVAVVDDIADLPGFGDAMASVGWVVESDNSIVFPNFFEEMNVDPAEELRAKNAERQRRFREKQAPPRNVTVTLHSNAREEKSREEKKRQTDRQAEPAEVVPVDTRDAAWSRVCDAAQLAMGRNLTASDDRPIREWFNSLPESVEIHANTERGAELAVRCLHAAAGGNCQTVRGLLSYAKTTMARCIQHACWPGEFPAQANPSTGRTDAAPDLAAIIADAQRKSAVARQIGAVNATE